MLKINKPLKKIFKYTSTIGIREASAKRYVLNREHKTVHISYGDVNVKYSSGYGISKNKAEFEDLKKIAVENDISLSDIKIDL